MSNPATLPTAGEGKGEPDTGVSVPLAFITYTPMLSRLVNAIASNLPSGDTLIPFEFETRANGEPEMGIKMPLAVILKIEIFAEPELKYLLMGDYWLLHLLTLIAS